MRVGIIALHHESNTFIKTPTTLEKFRQLTLAVGAQQVRAAYENSHHEVAGFLQGLTQEGFEAVPLFGASATPSGAIPEETSNALLEMAFGELDKAGKLDGLLVSPHGAAVGQIQRDLDGHWLTLVRQKVGPDMPVICTLDPHANVSPRMIDACNASIAYRSNPHLDQRQRGLEAAKLMARTLRGEVRPTQAVARPPIQINIERQLTSEAPCVPMYEFADRMLQRPGVLSNSIILGFPYADVAEMGSGFIVVTDNNPALARQCADELAQYLYDRRRDFVGQFIEIDQAIDMALEVEGPVCLLDMGDNVGGGSAADGTFIAHRLHHRRGFRSFVAIYDPQSVKQAQTAGVGKRVALRVGGRTDEIHGPPLEAQFTVRSLHDGYFTESAARHGGKTKFNMGDTVLVETDHGLTVQLTSIRTPPFSLGQVTSCGIDPKQYKILVAKGVNAPVAAYAPVCSKCIRVNTAGSTCADMMKFKYEHRRRPLYPFEEIPAAI